MTSCRKWLAPLCRWHAKRETESTYYY